MSEILNQKGNLIEIEAECEKLNHLLADSNSNRLLLFAITDFYEKLLQTKQTTIIDAYISQYINEYKNSLSSYDPFFISPITTEKIIESSKVICKAIDINEDKNFIAEQINRIETKSIELNKELIGNDSDKSKGLCFPVLEQEILQSKETFGLLESLTVQIRKSKNETKFLVIPSELHLEQKIQKQIDDSWLNAINFLKKNRIKISEKYYEILIAFDLKEGTIIGNSLGVVLTISFIEELLKFYNSSLIVNSKENIAITGGLDDLGKIISTSKEIIRIKTEIVFYSSTKTFCVPKVNEIDANERLFELKQQYPNRDLEIIGLTDLDDLLNRRNVVDVHKKNLVQIVATIILRKWKSILLAMVLTIVFSFLFVLDFDDNPAILSTQGEYLLIKNKNGKVLWAKNVKYPSIAAISSNFLNSYSRIYDINRDGLNEVLIAGAIFDSIGKIIDNTSLTCFDYTGNQVWQFKFNEEVQSKRENLGKFYSVSIIDTVTLDNKLFLYLIASNQSTFSSAIFPIDITNGKKSSGTFWCSGHTNAGVIKDFNGNSKPDIIATGVDNGYEQQVLFAFEIDTLNVSRKSIDEYFILDFPEAKTLAFLRFPKTDIDIFYNTRIPGIDQKSFYYDEAKQTYRFTTVNYDIGENAHLWIEVDKKLNNVNIIVDNQYRVIRDTLVAQGKLNPPLSDTEEFKQGYTDNILYLHNGEWVKRDKLK